MGLSVAPVRESLAASETQPLAELTIPASPVRGDYSRLLQVIVRLRKLSSGTGVAIGFTGVRSGSGVSYALEGVAKDLTRHSGESVLTTGAHPFSEASVGEIVRSAPMQHGNSGLANLRNEPVESDSGANGSWLKSARERFSYVLVDCAPPSVSSEILTIGPALAGIVLVVSSGQASREEIRHTIAAIQSSGGLLIGLVLNRYRSALPWRQL